MIDPDGRYAVSVHYRITVNAMLKMGYSSADAQRIAHGASVHADYPTSKVLSMDKWFHRRIVENHYRDDMIIQLLRI